MLLTTIVLFIAFGIFIVVVGRLLVKAFPPSAEDIEALHESHSSEDNSLITSSHYVGLPGNIYNIDED